MLISRLERVPSARVRRLLPLWVGKAARRLSQPLARLSKSSVHRGIRLGREGFLFGAVLVVLVILAPVAAVVGVRFGFNPLLRLRAVDICFERGRLAGRVKVLGLAISGEGSVTRPQHDAVQTARRTYKGDLVSLRLLNWKGCDMLLSRQLRSREKHAGLHYTTMYRGRCPWALGLSA